MLKNKAMLSIFIAVVFFAPFVASSDEPKENNAEETQVISLIDKMISNLQSGDIPRVMSTYADDAIVMFEPGVAVTDRKAIEQIFTEMAALKPEVTYSGHEVFIAGNTALQIHPWSMTAKTPDGQEIKQGGLSVVVLQRQTDGSWKMIIDNPYGSRLENK